MTRTTTEAGNVFNFVNGAGQLAGLIMLMNGLTSPRTILVRNDLGGVRALPVPYVTRQAAGLGLVASF